MAYQLGYLIGRDPPYVALYFAFQETPQADWAAIWALDYDVLFDESIQFLSQSVAEFSLVPNDSRIGEGRYFREGFLDSKHSLVCPMQPFRANDRVAIQQGVFICPGNVRDRFEENLLKSLDRSQKLALHKIEIATSLRKAILQDLDRMNITAATLFPGLDGFSRWLATSLGISPNLGQLQRFKAMSA
jgi:hypothetical protein